MPRTGAAQVVFDVVRAGPARLPAAKGVIAEMREPALVDDRQGLRAVFDVELPAAPGGRLCNRKAGVDHQCITLKLTEVIKIYI